MPFVRDHVNEEEYPETRGAQVLDCMWVYVYKFDKHGRLAKCKARLVVRGDQPAKSMISDTNAATLAARSFRVFMAIAARFEELIQYDAVNAFVHAKLDICQFMVTGREECSQRPRRKGPRESLYENAAWLSEARQNIEVESSTLWDIGHMIKDQERSHENYLMNNVT